MSKSDSGPFDRVVGILISMFAGAALVTFDARLFWVAAMLIFLAGLAAEYAVAVEGVEIDG